MEKSMGYAAKFFEILYRAIMGFFGQHGILPNPGNFWGKHLHYCQNVVQVA